MYIYIYIFMRTYLPTYIHTCMHTYIYGRDQGCMHAHALLLGADASSHLLIHCPIYTCLNIHKYIYICTYIYLCIHICLQCPAYIHTCIHTYTDGTKGAFMRVHSCWAPEKRHDSLACPPTNRLDKSFCGRRSLGASDNDPRLSPAHRPKWKWAHR